MSLRSHRRNMTFLRRVEESVVAPARTEWFLPSLAFFSLLLLFLPILFGGDGSTSTEALPSVTSAGVPVERPKSGLAVREVRNVDTLIAIAQQFPVEGRARREATPLMDPDPLRVGQRPVLPSPREVLDEIRRGGAPAGTGVPTEAQPEGAGRAIHMVKPGEFLKKIAGQYGVDVQTLLSVNPTLNPRRPLQPGQRLWVVSRKGVMHTVQKGESLARVAHAYRVSPEAIRQANPVVAQKGILAGDEIFVPGGSSRTPPTAYIWPVQGRLTDGYGYREHPISGENTFHQGIDIAVPLGRTFVAARSGRAIFSGWKGNFGRTIIIDHEDGDWTVYAHNSANLVKEGQYVKRGEVIGRVGDTGSTTGPNLHFEVRRHRRAVNPLLVFRQ